MHLHEVQNGSQVLDEYTVEGTPYLLRRFGDGWQVWRTPPVGLAGMPCRAETRELLSRFGGHTMSQETCCQISDWLQGVWSKRVALALAIDEAP